MARAKDRIGLDRYWGNLRQVARFARPYWKPIALSLLLMGIQAFASVGRLVMVAPIVTRVLDAPRALAEIPVDQQTDNEREALIALETYRTKGGAAAEALDDLVSWLNGFTGHLIPGGWLPNIPASLEEADREAVEALPPELDDTQRLRRLRVQAATARASTRDRFATLLSVLLMFTLMTAVMSAATYGELCLGAWARHQIVMDVRERICRRLLAQPVGFFDRQTRGELVQRALGDVGGYTVGLNVLLGTLPKSTIQLVTTMVVLITISPMLMLVCLVGIPFLAPMRSLSRRTLKRAHKRQQESAKLVESMLQIFSGIRTVKAYASEEQRAHDFRQTDESVTRQSMKVVRAKSTAASLVDFINNLLAMGLAVGGGLLIMLGVIDVSAPELLIFLAIASQLYQPIKRLVRQNNILLENMASVERTTEYMELSLGPQDPPDAVAFEGLHTAIRFEGVSFAYEADKPVLDNVSFEIPRGHTVALVGPSGAGKSTLCDLLLRFYEPTEGRIVVDGTPLTDLRRGSYLARAAIVTQKPFLFHDTIAANLRQGKPQATQDELEAAAKAAQIHEHIVSQPGGYQEVVGEDGVRMSGGQRQRITIARALIRDPDILVLDEATASLDTASERAVQEALDALRAGRTTLVVAHRLSTIRGADKILVMDDGRIVESGTHEELIGQSGTYAELVRMQDVST